MPIDWPFPASYGMQALRTKDEKTRKAWISTRVWYWYNQL